MSELIQVSGGDNPGRTGDVVFVHGLDGDARGTWQPTGRVNSGWDSNLTGLSRLDAADASENETSQFIQVRGQDLVLVYRSRVRVTSAKIRYRIDAKEVVAVDDHARPVGTRIETGDNQPQLVAAQGISSPSPRAGEGRSGGWERLRLSGRARSHGPVPPPRPSPGPRDPGANLVRGQDPSDPAECGES
ncbi:MAG: hypothetical protein JO329_15455 [Planctomycetaceae bacterium]|nr:hypothetical protein [Planctomycetaceae bacterium]MBV8268969.1 hypothetical protein [Planctomycetaceae bacterium]MBV8314095.1 hypothetical protein [Planctomycetaceae bacterium]